MDDDITKRLAQLEKRVARLEASTEDIEEDEPEYTPNVDLKGVVAWGGGIVFALGMLFFALYAFEQGWVSQAMQIVLGVLTGAFIILAGVLLRARVPVPAAVLSGAGIAVAYAAVYIGHAVEPYRQATGLTLAITIVLLVVLLMAGVWLVFVHKAPWLLLELLLLAHIALYLGPLGWGGVALVLLAALTFAGLCAGTQHRAILGIGAVIIAFFALINTFVLSPAQFYVFAAVITAGFTLVLFLLRAYAFTGVPLLLMWALTLIPLVRDGTTVSWVTLGVAGAMLLLYVFTRVLDDARSESLFFATGLTLLWAVIELSTFVSTLVWTGIGGVLLAYGLLSTERVVRNTGLVVLALAVGKLLLIDTVDLTPGLRVIAYVALGTLLLGASIVWSRMKD